MWITCKIISNNFLLYNKFKGFISQTPFFVLSEEINITKDSQIIFWDIDSINIDSRYIKENINNTSLFIILSSLLSKNVISELGDFHNIMKMDMLNKNITYHQFVDELSRIVDEKIEVKFLED